MTVGSGYDIHPLKKGRPMVLGGVKLDFPKGPVGHSDGDPVLHAVIDALLGAAGLGDIGEWFPDSDPRFKGADSAGMLATVRTRLAAEWRIVNVDVTVLADRPRLGPAKSQIRARIAQILELRPSQVNVKAKSLQGLGPKNAVAAQAIVELKAR